jgi:hypothetical protein
MYREHGTRDCQRGENALWIAAGVVALGGFVIQQPVAPRRRKADSDVTLAQMPNDQAKYSSFHIAQVYSFRGEADEAFKWSLVCAGLPP